MWTDQDIDYWIGRLQTAKGAPYRDARTVLIDTASAIGNAAQTEAAKQKRARYLAKREQRRAERRAEWDEFMANKS